MRLILRRCRIIVMMLTWLAALALPAAAQARPSAPLERQAPTGSAAPALTSATVSPETSRTWYFAEGYTGGTFEQWLTLANPGRSAANVTVTYLLEGMPSIVRTYRVNPYARFTVFVNGVVSGASVSMVVRADQPIVAERPMYFVDTDNPGTPVPGGTNTLGATTLDSTFHFAYLDTRSNHTTWLTLLNQNSYAIDARITYRAPDGTARAYTHTFGANSRGTVNVNQEPGLPANSYSATVQLFQRGTSTPAPGMVERPMYFKDGVTGWTGSAVLLGVPAAHADWYFAEGYTGSNFSERYILANPSTSQTAHASVTFMLKNGQTRTSPSVTLGPGQQQVIDVNALLGSAGGDNSAVVHADTPILADRFISFNYFIERINTPVPGASEVLGAAAPGNWFYFAEGYTGNQFDEWLTIQNPDTSRTAYVLVSFLPDNGATPTMRAYYIGPTTRFTLFTNGVMPGQSFSMVVQSSVPVVAERPMYFAYNGRDTGGSSVIGSQPTGPVVTPDPYSCTAAFGVTRVSPALVNTGLTSSKRVAITFDGGDPTTPLNNTASYLATLKAKGGLRVTWFLASDWANAHQDSVAQLLAANQEIGDHTVSHPNLTTLSPADVCAQLVLADQRLSDLTGRTSRPLFRPPSGAINSQVQNLAAALGFRSIMWSIDTIDWDDNTTPADILNRVKAKLAPGAIILMHVGSKNEPTALPTVIDYIQSQGYQIVPVTELLQ